MKQIVQSLDSGAVELLDVPAPRPARGHVLIRTAASVLSAGTERMLLDFGRANLINKVRQQPDKVAQVFEKVRTDGLMPTIEAVRSKLAQPIPLGYCNAGVVVEVGAGVEDLRPGDRVVSNGPHAELVMVPRNLCAKIPEGAEIPDEQAAFTVLASIGLEGMRLARPELGESFVVMGLGLIGLVTVQLLRAQGCRVLGADFSADRLAMARSFGADTVNLAAGEDPVAAALQFSKGRGVDGVLVTAATDSSEPMHQAASMCRKRGRIVLVGVTGLELKRQDFYEKELSFQVSCSYGPGRYDANYEQRGLDYPIGFVRWTAERNFEAVLDMLAEKKLALESLISHRFPFAEAPKAYDLLVGGGDSLGIVLQYERPAGEPKEKLLERVVSVSEAPRRTDRPAVAVIGAGNYGRQVLIPALKKADASLEMIVSSGGLNSALTARSAGFRTAASDVDEVFGSREVDTVFILTRHDSHADLAIRALKAGKHVFVEKPLALTREELAAVEAAWREAGGEKGPVLGVGFNRRFSPLTIALKKSLDAVREPKTFTMLVNAGDIPANHWVHDRDVGGGRIIGEACHFIDLLRHLAAAPIAQVQTMKVRSDALAVTEDKMTITLRFEDGSIGTVHYFANGHKGFPKERLEVFAAGRIYALDNFRALDAWGVKGFKKKRLMSQDKGHAAGVEAFLDAVRGKTPAPIPAEEIFEVTRASFDAVENAG